MTIGKSVETKLFNVVFAGPISIRGYVNDNLNVVNDKSYNKVVGILLVRRILFFPS